MTSTPMATMQPWDVLDVIERTVGSNPDAKLEEHWRMATAPSAASILARIALDDAAKARRREMVPPGDPEHSRGSLKNNDLKGDAALQVLELARRIVRPVPVALARDRLIGRDELVGSFPFKVDLGADTGHDASQQASVGEEQQMLIARTAGVLQEHGKVYIGGVGVDGKVAKGFGDVVFLRGQNVAVVEVMTFDWRDGKAARKRRMAQAFAEQGVVFVFVGPVTCGAPSVSPPGMRWLQVPGGRRAVQDVAWGDVAESAPDCHPRIFHISDPEELDLESGQLRFCVEMERRCEFPRRESDAASRGE